MLKKHSEIVKIVKKLFPESNQTITKGKILIFIKDSGSKLSTLHYDINSHNFKIKKVRKITNKEIVNKLEELETSLKDIEEM